MANNIAATLSLNVPAITALCKGDAGNTILNGTSNPTGAVGAENDFFLNTATGTLFGPKTNNLWGSGVILNNSVLGPYWTSTATTVNSNSANWNNAYTTVYSRSSEWDASALKSSSVFTTVQNNSAVFTTVQNNSADWDSTWSTVRSNSGAWMVDVDLGLRALSAGWQSTYSTVYANSAAWGTGGGGGGTGADTQLRSLSSRWESNYGTTNSLSANWSSTYTTVRSNSGDWESVYATVWSTSGDWNLGVQAYNDFQTFINDPVGDAAKWDGTTTTVRVNSGDWENVWSNVFTNSGNWTDAAWATNYLLSGIVPISADRWDYAYQKIREEQIIPGLGTWENWSLWDEASKITILAGVSGFFPRSLYLTDSSFPFSPISVDLEYGLNDSFVIVDVDTTDVTANISTAQALRMPIGWETTIYQTGSKRISLSVDAGFTIDGPTETLGTNTGARVVRISSTTFKSIPLGAGPLQLAETKASLTGGGTVYCYLDQAAYFTINMTGNTTVSFQNPPPTGKVGSFTVQTIGDGTARTLNWPSSVRWTNNTPPTYTSTNNKTDIFTFTTHNGGSTYYGVVVGQNFDL